MIVVGQEGPTVRKIRAALKDVTWGTTPSSPRLEPVICWGYPPSSLHYGHPILNGHLTFDKLVHHRKFREAGVATPQVVSTRDGLYGQTGITWLARSRYHERGLDVLGPMGTSDLRVTLERGERDYGIEYIPKDREWRVHALGDSIARIGQKRWQRTSLPRGVVWNEDAGWSFDYLSPCSGNRERTTLETLARRAVRAVGFDFGAVDIIARQPFNSSDYFVLEVNTAPGITGNSATFETYISYFKEWGESRI